MAKAKKPALTQNDILAKLGAGQITVEQAQALLERMNEKPLEISITDKGCVKVKGLWRFPVTLYPRMWERISEHMDQILDMCQRVPAHLNRDTDQAEEEDLQELMEEAA